MKPKQTRTQLPNILAQLFTKYHWLGGWPAFPIPHRVFSAEDQRRLPDTPPWVRNIYEKLFAKILPHKKDMSLMFYLAAIRGYAYSAAQRNQSERLKTCKFSREEMDIALRAITPSESGEDLPAEKKERNLTIANEKRLERFRQQIVGILADWKLPVAADYLHGFAYGIECQLREEGREPSASTQTLKIYKALLQHQIAIEQMTSQNATVMEIGELIAKHVTMADGMTFAQYFQKNPDIKIKETFLKNIQKYFERLSFSIRKRGRPCGK